MTAVPIGYLTGLITKEICEGFEVIGLTIGRHARLAFVQTIPSLLDSPVPVIATVAIKGGGLIAAVKDRSDVQLVEVTQRSRDRLGAN